MLLGYMIFIFSPTLGFSISESQAVILNALK